VFAAEEGGLDGGGYSAGDKDSGAGVGSGESNCSEEQTLSGCKTGGYGNNQQSGVELCNVGQSGTVLPDSPSEEGEETKN
jgi:hypothetical protein